MVFNDGHHEGTFTGALVFGTTTVNYTVVAEDPSSPGNFVQSSSGNITWTLAETTLTPKLNEANNTLLHRHG
jgi:hypothetical protein